MTLEKNFSLKSFNTFGIDARCDLFVEITNLETLGEVIHSSELKKYRKLVLGGGSNILFTKDFEGLVIKNSLRGIKVVKEDEKNIWVKAGAGEVWHELVLFCIRNNYAGI